MENRFQKNGELNEQEMQVLYQGSSNGIIIFRKKKGEDFICHSFNREFLTKLERKQEDLDGKSINDIFQGSEFSQLHQAIFNLQEYKTAYPVFATIAEKQYKVFPVMVEDENQVQSIVLSFNDRWRYSPAFYGNQVLLNTIQDGIFIFDVGNDGKYYLNFLNISHMAGTELNIVTDFGKTPQELIGPEEAKKVIDRYNQCVETRQSLIYEENLIFPNEEESTWWQTRISPVIIDGEVKQIIGSSRDITIQKNTMLEMQSLYSEYEALFNETAVPIWMEDVVDEQDIHSIKVKRYNPCFERTYGMKTEDFSGKTVGEIFSDPVEAERINERYAEVIRRREPIAFEIKLPINGQEIYNLTTLTPVLRDGKVVNIIGSSLDINELRSYQEELIIQSEMLADRVSEQKQVLQSSFKVQDDFLTSITEEFQEPLSSVLGLTELLLLTFPADDSRTLYLEQIRKQSERLLHMVEANIKENQSAAGEVLQIQSFDIKEMIHKIFGNNAHDFPSLDIRTQFEDTIPISFIWQDSRRVFRILEFTVRKAMSMVENGDQWVLKASYDSDQKEIIFNSVITLSVSHYSPEEREQYLAEFDRAAFDDLRNNIETGLIRLLIQKIGGKQSYQREENKAKIVFTIPLIQHVE